MSWQERYDASVAREQERIDADPSHPVLGETAALALGAVPAVVAEAAGVIGVVFRLVRWRTNKER